MMTFSRRTPVFVGLLLTLMVPFSTIVPSPLVAVAEARPDGNGGGYQGNGEQPRWLDQLNLSPSQTQQINQIRDRYRNRIDERKSRLFEAHQNLRQLMASDASNNEVRSQYRKVSDLRTEVSSLRFESMLEMREVLTPAQRSQLDDVMSSRGKRGGGRGRFSAGQ